MYYQLPLSLAIHVISMMMQNDACFLLPTFLARPPAGAGWLLALNWLGLKILEYAVLFKVAMVHDMNGYKPRIMLDKFVFPNYSFVIHWGSNAFLKILLLQNYFHETLMSSHS